MKKALSILLFGLAFAVGSANASIMFDIDGPGSSVVPGAGINLGGATLDLNLAAGLDAVNFNLSLGGSSTFDFFSIALTGANGWDALVGSIDASLAFSLPSPASASASGDGGAIWANTFFGFGDWFGVGGVDFNDFISGSDPADLTFSDGSIASIDFIGVSDACSGRGCDLTGTVQAKVTLLKEGSQVPEPSIIALFGLGLLGLGFARRKVRS